MTKRLLIGMVILASVVRGGTISVTPSPVEVSVGSSFNVNVAVDSVADLFAFQFDVIFDPTLVQALDVTEGTFLGAGGVTLFIPGSIDNIGGSISFVADSLIGPVSGVSGSGVLASLSFQALTQGTSPLVLSSPILLDSQSFMIEAGTGNGVVNIAAVPEPGTLVAFLAGCLVLAFQARFRVRR